MAKIVGMILGQSWFMLLWLTITLLVIAEAPGVDSKKLEHGCRMINAGVPSFFRFGFGRQSCSNVVTSTAEHVSRDSGRDPY